MSDTPDDQQTAPQVTGNVVHARFGENTERNREADHKVLLALHQTIWAEDGPPQGRVAYCQPRLNELRMTATEFQNSALRVLARAGFDCAQVQISQIRGDVAQVMIPTAQFDAHKEAFIAQWKAAKAQVVTQSR